MTTFGLQADTNGEIARQGGDSAGPGKEGLRQGRRSRAHASSATAAPYISSAKGTSSPSIVSERSKVTVRGEGERLEASARGGVLPSCIESISTRGEPIRRHIK